VHLNLAGRSAAISLNRIADRHARHQSRNGPPDATLRGSAAFACVARASQAP
jgi:hypothetical protein